MGNILLDCIIVFAGILCFAVLAFESWGIAYYLVNDNDKFNCKSKNSNSEKVNFITFVIGMILNVGITSLVIYAKHNIIKICGIIDSNIFYLLFAYMVIEAFLLIAIKLFVRAMCDYKNEGAEISRIAINPNYCKSNIFNYIVVIFVVLSTAAFLGIYRFSPDLVPSIFYACALAICLIVERIINTRQSNSIANGCTILILFTFYMYIAKVYIFFDTI